MVNAIKKVKYVLKEEGAFIFIKRFIAYLIFLIKVMFIDKKKLQNKWSLIHNKYAKKRIFIIGNGPSLNKTPLHLLENEYSFCFNIFNLMFERLNFVPQFYACIDDRVLTSGAKDIKDISSKIPYIFLPLIHPSSAKNFGNVFDSKIDAYWLILNKFTYSVNLPYIGINKSVANTALQIAAFLGFNEIYLIGVDLEYSDHKTVKKLNKRDWASTEDDDPNHFDPRYFGKGKDYHHPRLDETFKKFEEAKPFFENLGVKIFNAGIGGKLEVFPRVDFRSLFDCTLAEEMILFLKRFNKKEYISDNLIDYFPDALLVDTLDKWDDSYNYIVVTEIDSAVKLISKVIFEYIPYGPINNQYLFVKRN